MPIGDEVVNSGNVYIYIKATDQTGGDIHVSDEVTWNVSVAQIDEIRVMTDSTDWDLYLLQNGNGYLANDANIPMTQIMGNGNVEENIDVDTPYMDEDETNKVHLYFLDNSGSNTADFYITGHKLK